VRTALGKQQELGQHISAETRGMQMPGVLCEGPPRRLYDSVRAGPHRPFLSGTGESCLNSSIMHVVYDSRQMYPQYVLEVEVGEEAGKALADVAAADVNGASTGAPAAASRGASAPPAKRQCINVGGGPTLGSTGIAKSTVSMSIDALLRKESWDNLNIKEVIVRLEKQLFPLEPAGVLKPYKNFIREEIDSALAKIRAGR